MTKVFDPNFSTVLAVGVASAEVTTLPATDNQLRVYNSTTAPVFIRWGTTAQTAVATDLAIPPGGVEMFTKNNATRLAGIMSAGSGNLYISTGSGE
jgi:hypothetical protein